jgi:hypothetical protein
MCPDHHFLLVLAIDNGGDMMRLPSVSCAGPQPLEKNSRSLVKGFVYKLTKALFFHDILFPLNEFM